MFDTLGRLAALHPWKVLVAWLVVAVVLTRLAPDWQSQTQDDDIRFLPEEYSVVRGFQLMEKAFPRDVSASRAILALRHDERPLSRADFQLVDRLVTRLEELREAETKLQIGGIFSYRDGPVGSRLTSEDKHCTLIQLALGTPYLAVQTRDTIDRVQAVLTPILEAAGTNAPKLFVTGPAGIGHDLVKASGESLHRTTWATIALVVVVLLAVYRSPFLAMVPLITIGFAVWVSLQLLALATLIPGVHIVNVSQVFAIVILFGAGTDYCLFLIGRYREELEMGQSAETGIQRAMRSVGGALAASAGTVICGLGMMGFAEFGKIRSAGPVIAIGLAIGLLASLTITPALMRLGRKTVFWPMKIKLMTPARAAQGIWNAVSYFVIRRPGVVLVASLVMLLPLAVLGTRVLPSFKPIGDLSAASPSVRGLEAIQEHFTAGETGPISVLLSSRTDWNSDEGRDVIRQLSRGFGFLEHVAEVRSLTQPLGKPEEIPPETPPVAEAQSGLARFLGNTGNLLEDVKKRASEVHYLASLDENNKPLFVTRIDVVLKTDPFEAQSVDTLNLLETWMNELLPRRAESMGKVKTEVFGVTVHSRDMGRVVARDRYVVNALVTLGVFLILLILVKKFWLAAYLLATVLLSYYATLGATAIFTHLLTDKPFGLIEWRVPFFLFTILVAIGEDYNILLVTRVLQEKKRHGAIEGTRRGLSATGGTITACGIIMAGTFGTLMLADLSTLKQIGFALGIGVMMDTLIVRPLMVPAFLVLVWRDSADAEVPATPSRVLQEVHRMPPVLMMPEPQGRKVA